MPISTTHPLYEAARIKNKTTADAFDGEVKEYVPKLTSESNASFEARVGRPSFYNVTERTLLALLGALMRKPFTLEGLAGETPHTDNDNFEEYVQSAYKDILLTGRIGLFVDFDDEAQSPKLVTYSQSHIINWCATFIVLEETHTVHDEKDPYKLVSKTIWRELRLDDEGLFEVRLWEEQGRGKFQVYETVQPLIRGQRLSYIPFFFVTPYDNTTDLYAPPLYNLATLNVQHFKVSTDYSHGLHFLALPTPWIAGELYTADGNAPPAITIGTEQFIHLIQGSSAGFLEFGGTGMQAIADSINKIEDRMHSMGSRMLTARKGVESAEALHIRAGSESAVLETITNSLENGLAKALALYNEWSGSTVEPTIALNKDFTATKLQPEELKGLLAAYAAGVISLDTLLLKLFEGEIVPDPVAEKAALAQDKPEERPVVPAASQ